MHTIYLPYFAVDVFAQTWSCECVAGLRLLVAFAFTFACIRKRGPNLESTENTVYVMYIYTNISFILWIYELLDSTP